MNFEYCMPTRVVCGADNLDKLDALFPAGPILIVADRIMQKIGVTDRVQKILGNRTTAVFTDVEPNPSFETADRAAACAREPVSYTHLAIVPTMLSGLSPVIIGVAIVLVLAASMSTLSSLSLIHIYSER